MTAFFYNFPTEGGVEVNVPTEYQTVKLLKKSWLGYVMRESKGTAKPDVVNKILLEKVKKL